MAQGKGTFVWYELMTTDTEGAKAFYTKLIRWGTQPIPMPGGMRAVVAVAEQVRRLPAWLRPAAAGALIVGAMTLFKALLTILLQRRVTPQLLLAVATAIGIGAYGGAVGGLAYSVVRPRTRALGRLGDALTGVACAWACVLAIGIPYSLITGAAAHPDPVTIIAVLGVATAVGVAFGRSAFRSDEEDATGDCQKVCV